MTGPAAVDPGNSNWLTRLRQRLSQRGDSEHEQALVRLAICAVVMVYLVALQWRAPAGMSYTLEIVAGALFILFAAAIFVAIVVRPAASVARRYLAMVADNVANTFFMVSAGAAGSPLYGVYLWITIGYGVRYGTKYLFACQALSLIGFIVVWVLSGFWSTQSTLSVGLFLTLVLVPLYAAGLLGRLSTALAKAETASAAKSRFLATMSHEIRTPLNGILGIAQLLRPQADNDEQRDLLETLEESSQAVLSLIQNVLDISKIESGKLDVVKQAFSVSSLAEGVHKLFDFSARQKSVELTLHLAPNLPASVIADEAKLRQVLMNLVGNAVKFTPAGGSVSITCDVLARRDTQARLRFEVVDTGIGIPRHLQSSIFDPFTQADETITRKFGGTGLGTAIARQLVQLMGGTIGLESEEGRGAQFWFEVPVSVGDTAAVLGGQALLAELNILLLGVPAVDAELCKKYLRGWGVSYGVAASLEEARKALQEAALRRPFDFVLAGETGPLDLVDLSGLLQHELGQAALLAVYQETTPHSVDRLFSEGFAALVASPIDKTVLFNALHAKQNPQRARQVSAAAIAALGWPSAFPTYRILLADDNATNRKILETSLMRSGHTVVAASSGDEALEALAKRQFDLAILDVRMPDMSGIDVLKAWRFQEPAGLRLPILMLSADATQETIREALDAGAQAFLAKPVQLAELAERIYALAGPSADASATVPVKVPHSTGEAAATQPVTVRMGALAELAALSSDPAFLRNLIEGFVADTQRALDEMEAAIHAKNAALFRDCAHAIKGSASNIGAERLVKLCNEARVLTGHGLASRHPVLLAQMRVEFAGVSEILHGYARASAKPGRS